MFLKVLREDKREKINLPFPARFWGKETLHAIGKRQLANLCARAWWPPHLQLQKDWNTSCPLPSGKFITSLDRGETIMVWMENRCRGERTQIGRQTGLQFHPLLTTLFGQGGELTFYFCSWCTIIAKTTLHKAWYCKCSYNPYQNMKIPNLSTVVYLLYLYLTPSFFCSSEH